MQGADCRARRPGPRRARRHPRPPIAAMHGSRGGAWCGVPAYTFCADSEAVLASGCSPWFADIDQQTYCMNDWGAKNKIVIPVHTLGNMVDAESMKFWHNECGVSMIEDCAQNIGGRWKNKKAGTFGDISMFSGQGTKNLGAGEFGWCCTDEEELAERMRAIRNHSDYYSFTNKRKFDLSMVLGYNLRPSEFSAAIARCQLTKLPKFLDNFERNARLIFDLLPNGIEKPYYPKEVKPAWFILGCMYKGKHRNKFLEKLWEERRKARMLFSDKTPDIPGSNQPPSYSIGSGYKHLLHELPLYQKYKRKTPNADYVRNNIVWFDIHRWSDEERIKKNMEIVNRVYKEIEG